MPDFVTVIDFSTADLSSWRPINDGVMGGLSCSQGYQWWYSPHSRTGFTETHKSYIRAVVKFTRFLGRAPDRTEAVDLCLFHCYLTCARIKMYNSCTFIIDLHSMKTT